MQLNIEIKKEISSSFIDGIFATAIEGGINYWCVSAHTTENEKGEIVSAVFAEDEPQDENKPTFTVTSEGILEALKKLCERTVKVRSDIHDDVMRAIMEDDAGQIDSDLADTIIQIACFNELVYG